MSKGVAFVLRYIRTEDNLADYPSRNQVTMTPWKYFFHETKQ